MVTDETTNSGVTGMASVSRPMLVEQTSARTSSEVPAAETLLRGVRDSRPPRHPLDVLARRIAKSHTGAIRSHDAGCRSDTDAARREAVHAIDEWIEAHVPQHRHGCAMHTETVGSVIDRLMAAYARAAYLLETSDGGDTDLALHAAWFRVAELVNGYDDLCTAISRGERRLPTSA